MEREEKEKQNKMACREWSKFLWLQNNGIEFASTRKIKNVATPCSSHHRDRSVWAWKKSFTSMGNYRGEGKTRDSGGATLSWSALSAAAQYCSSQNQRLKCNLIFTGVLSLLFIFLLLLCFGPLKVPTWTKTTHPLVWQWG